MRSYLIDFFAEFDYPEQSRIALLEAYDLIDAITEAKKEFYSIEARYAIDMLLPYDEIKASCTKISELTGIHIYTTELLAYISMTHTLRYYYEKAGLPYSVYKNSMLDLRYKLKECLLVKGIHGSFVAHWFRGFFILERFALGRLQFEIIKSPIDYTKGDKKIAKGDPVINIHIPRTETPLARHDCLEAYSMAKEFFKDRFGGTKTPFVCSSWLLFPKLRELLPESSNIITFAKDFDIVETVLRPEGEHPDIWRIYDMDYTGNLDDLPSNSTLRRNYLNYLKNSGREGVGKGFFFI